MSQLHSIDRTGRSHRSGLLDLDALDVEDQRRVTRDAGKALGAICQVCGNGDSPLATNGHAGNTNVPALDDLAATELEAERLALLVAVEDLAVLELANVAHADTVTLLGCRAASDLLVVNCHAVDGLDASGSLWLLSLFGLGSGGRRASGALLKVLCELDLLVGSFWGLPLLESDLIGSDRLASVVLQLLLLLLAELLRGVGDQVIKSGGTFIGTLLGGALVLALLVGLLAGSDKSWCLRLGLDLGDAGVLQVVQCVFRVLVVELILVRREVVVLLILGIVLVVVIVRVLVVRLDVVSGEIDAVGS